MEGLLREQREREREGERDDGWHEWKRQREKLVIFSGEDLMSVESKDVNILQLHGCHACSHEKASNC